MTRAERKPIKGTLYFYCAEKEDGQWAFLKAGETGERALRILENGDRLTIYSSSENVPRRAVWSGTIKLTRHEPRTQRALGYWIQAEQEGVSRDEWALWFFNHCPAEIIPAE